MSSLNSMRQKLKPLGFYNLNDNSLISAELSAYATALDEIEYLLDEAEQECFIATAKGYGLSERERMLGAEQKSQTVEYRRENLLYRYSITSNSFNKDSIAKVLSVSGINGHIIEIPNENTLYINCLSLNNSSASKEAIVESVKEFLPAHLNCIFDFRNLGWDTIDGNDNTFDTIDSKNLTWDDIDSFNEI